jgi:hypothetical protein
MNIGSVSASWATSQVSQTSSASQSDSVGDIPPPPDGRRGAPGGGFIDAITQALKQLGVTNQSSDGTAATTDSSTDSSSSTKASQDPAQALGAFIQSLMAALHAQSSGTAATTDATAAAATDSANATSATSGHHGGRGHLEADLQSLIQQIDSGTTATTASTDSTASSDSSSGSSATSDLQSKSQDLLAALGDSGSKATLGSFLTALESKFEGAPPTGNVVNAQA